jgi:hypothetical protein
MIVEGLGVSECEFLACFLGGYSEIPSFFMIRGGFGAFRFRKGGLGCSNWRSRAKCFSFQFAE